MNHTPYDRFTTFLKQREQVRLNGRTTGVYAPILKEWRFCNVNREDDRVTKWIAKHLRKEKNPRTLVMKLTVGRFINWPPTLQKLLDRGTFNHLADGWSPNSFLHIMDDLMEDAKGKVYTGAYMIRAGTGEDASMPKHEYLVKRVFNPLWAHLTSTDFEMGVADFRKIKTCEDWGEYLSMIFGMGDFMRNQIITDMKYTKLLPRKTTPDWTTFCLAGPGTNRGLNRLDGSPLKRVRKASDAQAQLITLRRYILARFTHTWWYDTFEDLNNLSNCLCEFDKAERVRLGEGTPRSRYTPTKD